MKIYDCSNSNYRPRHISGASPYQNDIVRHLKEHAHEYGCSFVYSSSKADVLFTNDIFPLELQKKDIYKVKRMDGIYFLNNLKHRNIPLNQSAEIANHVIFISHFSASSYAKLYGSMPFKINKWSIIRNAADDKIFYPAKKLYEPFTWAVCAANWAREEKRFSVIKTVMEKDPSSFNLIGECPFDVPKNVTKYGFLKDPIEIADILRHSTAMINLSYKDAGPKVVAQALQCGLPVVYARSGGVPEFMHGRAKRNWFIEDNLVIEFEDEIPKISLDWVFGICNYLKDVSYQAYLTTGNPLIKARPNFRKMLDGYFAVLTNNPLMKYNNKNAD